MSLRITFLKMSQIKFYKFGTNENPHIVLEKNELKQKKVTRNKLNTRFTRAFERNVCRADHPVREHN